MHKSLMHFCSIFSYSELHKMMFWLFNALGEDSLKGSRNTILITGVNHICWCWLWGFSLNMLNLCSKLRNALCRFAFLIQQSCVLLHKPREVKNENTQLECWANTRCREDCESKSTPVSKDMPAPIQLWKLGRFMELKSLFSCLEKKRAKGQIRFWKCVPPMLMPGCFGASAEF